VIPSGIPHSYGSLNENPWTIFWIHLNGTACNEAVKAVMGNADLPARAINAGVYKERLLIFEGIEQVLLKGYSVNNLMYANLSLQYFLASFILPDNFQPPELINVPLSSSEKAIEFMQNNLSRPAVLLDIANGVNLSVSYFSRIFKKDTGYSPVEYFNYLKIQRACQLLHSGNLRINEVAMAIGVEDAFYFSRLFKKQIGIPPAKYRKANQMLQ
jgi:AraC-like DNA-binding protein